MKSINKDPAAAIEEVKSEKVNLLLDSQILSTVQSCGWQFYAKFIENYRPTGRKSPVSFRSYEFFR